MLKPVRGKSILENVVYIAASDSSDQDKVLADIVCTGNNDELVISRAVEGLIKGGTVQLFDGNYNIDSFPYENNSAIFFGYNNGQARVVNLVGCTENKSYNTRFGVTLHVTEKAFGAMADNTIYRVFSGTDARPPSEGDFFTMTHVNNIGLENFYLYFFDASKRIIGIDCSWVGSAYIRQVGIYTENYFRDRFLHLKPATPIPGCTGIRFMHGSNDEMARIGYDTVNVGGLHTGFEFQGVDHLVMRTCSAARCCYGYVLSTARKTLTMINCCDEGNTHLPKFSGTGHLTAIDFNIERFNADFIPDDITGDTNPGAVEETPGGWHGFLSYTLQGKAFGLRKFWQDGSGLNFRTENLDHSRISRPECPEYLEQYFDTASNKMLIWNGYDWVDPMGNIVK